MQPYMTTYIHTHIQNTHTYSNTHTDIHTQSRSLIHTRTHAIQVEELFRATSLLSKNKVNKRNCEIHRKTTLKHTNIKIATLKRNPKVVEY